MANRGAYTQPAEQDSFINGQPASGNPYTYEKPRSGKRNKWLWIGLPILLIVVILAAVLGGVLGSRASNDDSNNSSNSASDNGSNNGGTGTSTVTATDTQPWISGAASNIPNSISESTIKLASAAAKLGGMMTSSLLEPTFTLILTSNLLLQKPLLRLFKVTLLETVLPIHGLLPTL